LNRSGESLREAIGKPTCANQGIEALIQFATERFQITGLQPAEYGRSSMKAPMKNLRMFLSLLVFLALIRNGKDSAGSGTKRSEKTALNISNRVSACRSLANSLF
jgi:hypothetical protein